MPVRRDSRNMRWIFRTTVRLPDGTRRRISGSPGSPGPFHDLAQSKVGAQEAERRAIQRALNGERDAAERPKEVPTVKQFAETFLVSYKPSSNPSTKRSRRRILRNHIVPVIGKRRLDGLLQTDVSELIVAWSGRAQKTVNNRLAVLSSLLRFAVKLGVIPEPKHKLSCQIAPGVVEMEAVAPRDVERLLACAKDDRIRVAVLLCFEAGLRSGEVRGLQWGDIDRGSGLLTIRRSVDNQSTEIIPPKGKRDRLIPLSPRLASALGALPKRGLWVVSRFDGGLLGYSGLNKPIRRLYLSAGVELPRFPAHALRHGFGTQLAANGVPIATIKELMGHRAITTTQKYIHVGAEQKRDAVMGVFGGAAWQRDGSTKKETP